jgi:hypothetical protein
MTDRNLLARAADQRAVHTDSEVTIHDKGHRPSWRRSGARGRGEITFHAEIENGIPVLVVRTVEIHQPRDGRDEVRETVFEVFGSAALEVLEVVRELEGPVRGPKGDV